jgi:dethiobiotin synthetase
VAARKPAQSFDVDGDGTPLGGPTDAAVLAGATGEPVARVCPDHRAYHRAMAPPMAAEALGLPAFSVADLVAELDWPDPPVDVGLVETAGGVRSPQADDGDAVDLARVLRPDAVVLVGDAGLGTVNGVRLSVDALTGDNGPGPVVVLNRFDPHHDLHRRNLRWLTDRCDLHVVVLPGDEGALAAAVLGR